MSEMTCAAQQTADAIAAEVLLRCQHLGFDSTVGGNGYTLVCVRDFIPREGEARPCQGHVAFKGQVLSDGTPAIEISPHAGGFRRVVLKRKSITRGGRWSLTTHVDGVPVDELIELWAERAMRVVCRALQEAE